MKTTNNPHFSSYLLKFCPLLIAALFTNMNLSGQEQVYDNFEGTKVLYYGERFGVLDTLAKNPASNNVNNSSKCGMYVRNGAKKFANIKMNLPKRITAVEAYATYLGVPPKIKLKVYTSAPVGTLVEILLGAKRGNNDYPAGTHSQYQAYTTKSNEWEELEFKFSQIPQGSQTAADQIDQIVLLFNPNSSNSDTYYFDDLTGPPILSVPDSGNSETDKNNKPEKPRILKTNKPMSKKTTAKKK
jgi:hypothetical protein